MSLNASVVVAPRDLHVVMRAEFPPPVSMGMRELKEDRGVCTHTVAITLAESVDDEAVGYLRRAYELTWLIQQEC